VFRFFRAIGVNLEPIYGPSEILLRSAGVPSGDLHDPLASKQPLDEGGRLHTKESALAGCRQRPAWSTRP
jgi:hypothetical protein